SLLCNPGIYRLAAAPIQHAATIHSAAYLLLDSFSAGLLKERLAEQSCFNYTTVQVAATNGPEEKIQMSKPRVLITRRWPEAAERAMQRYFDVTLNETDTPLTEAELVNAMQHYDALCPCVTDKINSTVLSATSPQ